MHLDQQVLAFLCSHVVPRLIQAGFGHRAKPHQRVIGAPVGLAANIGEREAQIHELMPVGRKRRVVERLQQRARDQMRFLVPALPRPGMQRELMLFAASRRPRRNRRPAPRRASHRETPHSPAARRRFSARRGCAVSAVSAVKASWIAARNAAVDVGMRCSIPPLQGRVGAKRRGGVTRNSVRRLRRGRVAAPHPPPLRGRDKRSIDLLFRLDLEEAPAAVAVAHRHDAVDARSPSRKRCRVVMSFGKRRCRPMGHPRAERARPRSVAPPRPASPTPTASRSARSCA